MRVVLNELFRNQSPVRGTGKPKSTLNSLVLTEFSNTLNRMCGYIEENESYNIGKGCFDIRPLGS